MSEKRSNANSGRLQDHGEKLNFKNIFYGEMVDVVIHGGISCSCTVHMFNRKGVLVGREYEFVKYDTLRRHPKGLCWEQKWVEWGSRGKPNKKLWRQLAYETVCRIVTVLMRWTETQMHPDIIKGKKFVGIPTLTREPVAS